MAEENAEKPASAQRPAGAAKKVQKKPYLIVGARLVSDLENMVCKLVLQGYRPQGSLQVVFEGEDPYYYQAVVLSVVMK